MDDKQLAFLRVTDPEKYKEHLQAQELKKKLAFPKLLSNMVDDQYVARMYEAFSGRVYVVEADGSHYPGKITRRKYYRRYKDEVGRDKPGFWTYFYECEDGRWFDNTGYSCEKPKEQRQPVDEIIED
jgi:hypothetical protein